MALMPSLGASVPVPSFPTLRAIPMLLLMRSSRTTILHQVLRASIVALLVALRREHEDVRAQRGRLRRHALVRLAAGELYGGCGAAARALASHLWVVQKVVVVGLLRGGDVLGRPHRHRLITIVRVHTVLGRP